MNLVVHRQFAALGDPTRLAIVERLARGPASAGDLAAPTALSLPAVLKHVRVLEEAGLVTTVKRGRVRVKEKPGLALAPNASLVCRVR